MYHPILAAIAFAGVAAAQTFAGLAGGVSTLSADGRSIIEGDAIRVSLYKPENGPTFHLFGGRHFSDFLSAQGSYSWNGNDVALTAVAPGGFSEQPRSASHHTVVGELMLYFRSRRSFARPYLTAGGGYAYLSSEARGTPAVRGIAPLAPAAFDGWSPCLRVAVGIDLRLARGLAFRYTFSETIQKNTLSERLSPPGRRNLANFQNLFGFVWTFQRF